jgi:hypothetical protein
MFGSMLETICSTLETDAVAVADDDDAVLLAAAFARAGDASDAAKRIDAARTRANGGVPYGDARRRRAEAEASSPGRFSVECCRGGGEPRGGRAGDGDDDDEDEEDADAAATTTTPRARAPRRRAPVASTRRGGAERHVATRPSLLRRAMPPPPKDNKLGRARERASTTPRVATTDAKVVVVVVVVIARAVFAREANERRVARAARPSRGGGVRSLDCVGGRLKLHHSGSHDTRASRRI